jgi:hypothetical protein
MEHFEKLALYSAEYKPSLWPWYIYGTFVVWPHVPEQLQNFLNHLNSLRTSIQFTMETVRVCDLFSGHSSHQKGTTPAPEVYRKPTHTYQYLNFK